MDGRGEQVISATTGLRSEIRIMGTCRSNFRKSTNSPFLDETENSKNIYVALAVIIQSHNTERPQLCITIIRHHSVKEYPRHLKHELSLVNFSSYFLQPE